MTSLDLASDRASPAGRPHVSIASGVRRSHIPFRLRCHPKAYPMKLATATGALSPSIEWKRKDWMS